eukprot:SAG31_NODE_12430_length_942_cov_5.460261_3_plen_71_part_00
MNLYHYMSNRANYEALSGQADEDATHEDGARRSGNRSATDMFDESVIQRESNAEKLRELQGVMDQAISSA